MNMKTRTFLVTAILGGLLSLALGAPASADPPPWTPAWQKHHDKWENRWNRDHGRWDGRHWDNRWDHDRDDRWNRHPDGWWRDADRGRGGSRASFNGRCGDVLSKIRENEYYVRRWQGTGRHEKIVRGARNDLPGQYRDLRECRSGSAGGYGRYSSYESSAYDDYDDGNGYGGNGYSGGDFDWPAMVGGLLSGNLGR
jgi:hypothetical protein